MLISFTVGNYRSFKDKVTLSMEVEPSLTGLEDRNFIEAPRGRTLLNAAAIYGANASGKSNLIRAFHFMCDTMLNSARGQESDTIETEPFLLDDDGACASQPSFFEMNWFLEGVEYTYGFEVTKQEVVREWLRGAPAGRTTYYFVREGQTFPKMSKKNFAEGMSRKEFVRSNALFLSTVAQLNGETARNLIRWAYFSRGKSFPFDDATAGAASLLTLELIKKVSPETPFEIAPFVRALDLSILDLRLERGAEAVALIERAKKKNANVFEAEMPGDIPTVKTIHRTPGGREVEFDALRQESDGSNKLIAVAFPVLMTLSSGTLYVIDELDARLHPLLTIEILKLFQAPKTNPKGAQIVFTTHDTNLLSQRVGLLRRDQVWFTEKRPDQSTDLYCLSEFTPRQEEALDRNYLRGKYGAVPFISDLDHTLGAHDEQK